MIRIFIALLTFILISACNDSSLVGSEIIKDQDLNTKEDTSFVIEGMTINGIPQAAFINNVTNYSTYPIGSYADPIFGQVDAEVITKLNLNSSVALPEFKDAIIDSVIMVMTYDTSGMYGDLSAPVEIIVSELESDPKTIDTIFSNFVLPPSTTIGRRTISIKPSDSITIKNYLADTLTEKLSAQIRVPLSTTWLSNLIKNSTEINTNELLLSKIKGIKVSANSQNKSLLGLNFSPTADNAVAGVNGIYVYLKGTDNVRRIYRFLYSGTKYLNAKTSFASGPQGNVLNNLEAGKNLLYVQGLDGVRIEFNITDLDRLKGKIINHAELELTAAKLPNDDLSLYKLNSQLIAGKNVLGKTQVVTDISKLSLLGITTEVGFGGRLIEKSGTPLGTYKMNVTTTVKELIEDAVNPNKIIIWPIIPIQRPARSVIYGTKHPQYPVKLRVVYTTPI